MALEQLLKQQKLGVQVLVLRLLVNDGNALQRALVPRKSPLLAEHVHDALAKSLCRLHWRHQWLHLGTAGPLGPRQCGVEHGTTGVGVDLDEPQPALGDMKVVAKEHPPRAARVQSGNVR